MDVITAVLVAAISNLADHAVRDGYAALKGLISRKLGSASTVIVAVEELERAPKSKARQAVVREELEASGAGRDAELLRLAQELLQRLGESAGHTSTLSASGQTSVAISGDVTGVRTHTGGISRSDSGSGGTGGSANAAPGTHGTGEGE